MDITLNHLIDHTLLKPDADQRKIEQLCKEAETHQFASVCINPFWVKLASKYITSDPVLICTVVGFPIGANATIIKAKEASQAIEDGAHELDMVINIGALKSGLNKVVLDDIAAVVKAAGKYPVKVIIEACYLTDEEKILACKLSQEAGAAFVKTSTGFGTGNATVEDVRLMRKTVGPKMGVKASGGLRNKTQALQMVEAGATRLGTSSGIAIVSE